MDHSTTTAAPAATLTQSELFQRYLDAPVRVDATTSSLIADPGTMFGTSARDWFLYDGFGGSLPRDYTEELIAQIEGDEYPLFALERITGDLSELLAALDALKHDFERLTDVTRTAPPLEDTGDIEADADAFCEWEENPRYVLPLIEQKEAA